MSLNVSVMVRDLSVATDFLDPFLCSGLYRSAEEEAIILVLEKTAGACTVPGYSSF